MHFEELDCPLAIVGHCWPPFAIVVSSWCIIASSWFYFLTEQIFGSVLWEKSVDFYPRFSKHIITQED